ncbi:MAG: PKD domain-containing protein, partial [Bacteroidota bacterium]
MRTLIFFPFIVLSLVVIGKQKTEWLPLNLKTERHVKILENISHEGVKLLSNDWHAKHLLTSVLDTFACTADFISQTNGCNVSFSDQSSASGIVTNYYWDFGDGSFSSASFASHTYATSGTYQVSLTIGTNTGCIDTVSKTVTVSGCGTAVTCDADFISQTDSCTLSFSDQSSTSGIVLSYAWDFGDGTTGGASSTSHTYTSSGTYPVQLTITTSDGCTDTVSKTITVTNCAQPPTCDADFVSQTDSCTVSFSDQSSTLGIIGYVWDFGDGNTGGASYTTHTYNAPGTYDVTLTISTNDGCVDSITRTVTVTECPVPSFCSPDFIIAGDSCTISFTDSSSSSNGILSYEWDFGDGNTGSSDFTTHTYDSAGTYTVQLTIITNDSCTNSISKIITVNNCVWTPTCDADFASQTDSCTVTFGSQSSSGGIITSYVWDFGDGNTGGASYVPYTYNAPGTYDVTLTISTNDGCVDSITRTVTVTECPVPSFCSPDFIIAGDSCTI